MSTNPKSELPIHINLALSNLHAAIDRWEKWREELYQAIADLNSHAARHANGLTWPPPATPEGPNTTQEAAMGKRA